MAQSDRGFDQQPVRAGEGLITVDRERGNTPAMVALTREGIRRTEAEDEASG
ncbi:hypothetical protein [Streptomyces sp. NPDC006463]|uniref:hypothetical protein n=1 Tax=Streptomyces sp. NPDC006463 TaxID=3364746 RepID=UPI003685B989